MPGWERDVLEKLVFATLSEQRSARRWRIFTRLAWLIFLIAVAWVLLARDATSTSKSTPHTAVVDIKGEIAAGAEASAEFVVAAMRSAFEDSGSQAVVLLINSPGGSPVQAGIINDEIIRLKAKYNKPVYAVVEETCASAAYYIAAAADEIYVDKASIVGSIGVLMDGFGFTGTMEKLGVERRLLTAGENKGFLDPFSPQTEKQRAYAQAMLDQIHQQFIHVVKEGRGDRSSPLRTLSAACSGPASKPWRWGWPTTWATSTTWHARSSRPKTSSTTPAVTTLRSGLSRSSVRPWGRPRYRPSRARLQSAEGSCRREHLASLGLISSAWRSSSDKRCHPRRMSEGLLVKEFRGSVDA